MSIKIFYRIYFESKIRKEVIKKYVLYPKDYKKNILLCIYFEKAYKFLTQGIYVM